MDGTPLPPQVRAGRPLPGFTHFTTGNSYVVSSPAVANGRVYVGSDKVYALNVTTGAILGTGWTHNSYVYSSPAVADGRVYVGATSDFPFTPNTSLYAFGLLS